MTSASTGTMGKAMVISIRRMDFPTVIRPCPTNHNSRVVVSIREVCRKVNKLIHDACEAALVT